MAEGRVIHRGAPLAGCQVLAIDGERVVADALTGPDGRWTLPGAPLVFARCRGEAIGVVAGAGGDLVLAPTHALTIRVEGGPETAVPQVLLTPLRLDGVAADLLRWISAPVRQAADGVLAEFVARERTLFAQAGRWWLTAHHSVSYSARPAGAPTPTSWSAASATCGGAELPAREHGFELELAGPADVTIRLSGTG
jgi:hypothetical protein